LDYRDEDLDEDDQDPGYSILIDPAYPNPLYDYDDLEYDGNLDWLEQWILSFVWPFMKQDGWLVAWRCWHNSGWKIIAWLFSVLI
jgi:hypothetical protein